MNKCMMAALAGVAIIATGCISVNKNDGGCDKLAPEVVKEKVLLQYDVKDTPVTATDTVMQVIAFQFGSSATHIADDAPASSTAALLPIFPSIVDAAKNGAFANACEAAGADTIVGARYKVTVEDYVVFKKATAEITGYPATMKGIKKIDCPKACPAN